MGKIFAGYEAYLGAGASVSQWQMGLASGKTLQVFGTNFESNKPDPLLYLAVISASLVYNKTWGITYQGEFGFAQPLMALSKTEYAYTPPRFQTLSAQAQIFRTDHSLALSRVLGSSGFSLYAGFKVQAFGYQQNDGKFTEVETGTGTPTEERSFSIKQNILNYGPAAGVTYSFRIFQKVSGALQAGLIYLSGKYSNDMAFSLIPGMTMNNTSNEDFYGIGATALASVIFPLADGVLLQLGGRGQYYYARTRQGTTTMMTTTQTKQSSSGTMDNVQDILVGVQAAVICKIF